MNSNNKLKGRVICLFFMVVSLAACKQEAPEAYFEEEGFYSEDVGV